MRFTRPRMLAWALCAAFITGAAVPRFAAADAGNPEDPLLPLINRINSYFHRHEIDGITRDSRYPLNPSEVIRLSVVSQLLAYNDLYASDSLPGYYQDIVDRADFLLPHMSEITSRTAFDGMLGYALLGAYEITGDARYADAAAPIVARCKALSGFQNTMNWGLMSAMALAKQYDLTGDAAALNKTREIVASVKNYQHADGSFAHYCVNSTDVHYTGWMGMELIHVGRFVNDSRIEPMLLGMNSFLKSRVDATGNTVYQEPCPDSPGCWKYYYGLKSGCPQDYDTRAWVNELGYNALMFDHFQEPKYHDVMGFLYRLENKVGTYPDKWDYFPPPNDDIYPWAVGDSSIIRTSVVFWSLATAYRARMNPVQRRYDVALAEPQTESAGPTLSSATWRGAEAFSAAAEAPDPEEERRGGRRFHWFTVDSLVLADADMEDVCSRWLAEAPLDLPDDGPDAEPMAGHPHAAERALPASTRLELVTSNPTRGETGLRLALAADADVSVEVFDGSGRRVASLVHQRLGAGEHLTRWSGRDAAGRTCANGLYFVRARVGQNAQSLRLLLLH